MRWSPRSQYGLSLSESQFTTIVKSQDSLELVTVINTTLKPDITRGELEWNISQVIEIKWEDGEWKRRRPAMLPSSLNAISPSPCQSS